MCRWTSAKTLVVVSLAATTLSAQAPAAFDSSKAWEHLRQQVAIGPRPSGSPGNLKNREYITTTLAGFGIKMGIMPVHVWLPSAHATAQPLTSGRNQA